jgi:hypothetical protein
VLQTLRLPHYARKKTGSIEPVTFYPIYSAMPLFADSQNVAIVLRFILPPRFSPTLTAGSIPLAAAFAESTPIEGASGIELRPASPLRGADLVLVGSGKLGCRRRESVSECCQRLTARRRMLLAWRRLLKTSTAQVVFAR